MISRCLYSLGVIAYITVTPVSFLVKCASATQEGSAASVLCKFLFFSLSPDLIA